MFNKSLKVLSLVSASFIVASCSFQMPNNSAIKENAQNNLKANIKEKMAFKTKSATTPIMAGLVPEGDSITVTLSGSPKVYKFYATSGKPYKVRLSQLDAKDAHLKIFKPSNNTTTPDFQNDNSTGNDSLVAFNANETGYWRIEASTHEAVTNNTDPTGAFELGLNDDSGFSHPVSAMDANGNFVVAWQEYGTDGSGWGVYARKFDKYGSALGAAFKVNGTTAGDQKHPAVAISKDTGFFIITWEGSGAGDSTGIFMKRFNADTSAYDGGDFRINTNTDGTQANPSVAVGVDGYSVVSWQTIGSAAGATDGIWLFRMGASSLGPENRVNISTNGYRSNARLAVNQESTNYGDFVIVWQGNGAGDPEGIYERRFNLANTTSADPEYQINGITAGLQSNPDIAMASDGKFLFTWQNNGNGDTNDGIFIKFMTAGGGSGSGDLRVNSTISYDYSFPRIALNQSAGVHNGDFILTWQGIGPGDDSAILQRRLNINTQTALDPEYRANYIVNGVQGTPSFANSAITTGDASLGAFDNNYSRFIQVWSVRGTTDNTDGIYATASRSNNNSFGSEGRISNAPPPPTTIIGGIK